VFLPSPPPPPAPPPAPPPSGHNGSARSSVRTLIMFLVRERERERERERDRERRSENVLTKCELCTNHNAWLALSARCHRAFLRDAALRPVCEGSGCWNAPRFPGPRIDHPRICRCWGLLARVVGSARFILRRSLGISLRPWSAPVEGAPSTRQRSAFLLFWLSGCPKPKVISSISLEVSRL